MRMYLERERWMNFIEKISKNGIQILKNNVKRVTLIYIYIYMSKFYREKNQKHNTLTFYHTRKVDIDIQDQLHFKIIVLIKYIGVHLLNI